MDQNNERLLDIDSNPDLEWWSELDVDVSPEAYGGEKSEIRRGSEAKSSDKSSEVGADTSDASPGDEKSEDKDGKFENRSPKSEQSAVIDRFEGKLAVLLVGEDEKVVNVPRSSLPKRVRAGHWLKVQLSEDEPDKLVSAEPDPAATEAARARISEKLAKLRSGSHRS